MSRKCSEGGYFVVFRKDNRVNTGDVCTSHLRGSPYPLNPRKKMNRGFAPFISKAPVLLIPCTSEAAYHRRYREADKVNEDGTEINWPVPYWFMDIGCAVMIALLAAIDEGLVSAFAGSKDLDALRVLLDIPAEVTPVGVIALGYRAPDVPSPSLKRGRKADTEYIHREGW